MIEINIPGRETVKIEHAVFDYNGTLALDGIPLEGILEKLLILGRDVKVHIVTADTFGAAGKYINTDIFHLAILDPGDQDKRKRDFIFDLGKEGCAAFGNGRNDALMLSTAALGFAVIGPEGACGETLRHSDLVFVSIHDAVDALLHPKRIAASLRR